MISDNFSLEDKLTYEELAPSLQDMFKILNIGTIITDVMENGTNGKNIKIDSRNTLLFDDDDFRTAKITETQIMVSDIDMINWDTATAVTESNPSTQIIPNRIFLYDVGTTNLWYYQDWDHRWCIRKDVSIDTTKAKPGEIVKLNENSKITLDSNFRLKRMVGPDSTELYIEAKRNPKAATYTDNDYNIYAPVLDDYYVTKNVNTYPPANTSDQDALNNYYTLSEDKAANKLISRTWFYNPGQETLFFYKYKKKVYELNTDYRTFDVNIVQSANQTITVTFNNGITVNTNATVRIIKGTTFTASVSATTDGYTPGILNVSSGTIIDNITISASPAFIQRHYTYQTPVSGEWNDRVTEFNLPFDCTIVVRNRVRSFHQAKIGDTNIIGYLTARNEVVDPLITNIIPGTFKKGEHVYIYHYDGDVFVDCTETPPKA